MDFRVVCSGLKFECYAGLSPFHRFVAKPLLSMGTVGSMDCERRAKPLEQTILTKKRNRMSDSNWVRKSSSHYECKEVAWEEALGVPSASLGACCFRYHLILFVLMINQHSLCECIDK